MKPPPHGIFTSMTKRRVAKIMEKTARGCDGFDGPNLSVCWKNAGFPERLSRALSKAPRNCRDLKRVCKASAYIIVRFERKDLCFVLKPPNWS